MYQSSTYNFSSTFSKGSDLQNLFFSEKEEIDYYPFGMLMPNRHGAKTPADNHRYGYQGSESDDEVHGTEGTSYTTHFRQLDTRVGKWLSIDPKATPWESPYVSMGNNPIWYNDVLGDVFEIGGKKRKSKSDVKSLVKRKNKKYIKIKNGNVTLDFKKMSVKEQKDLLKNDEGLSLINDLVSSSKIHLYESSNVALMKDEQGNNTTAALFQLPHNLINASNGGDDSNGGHRDRPKGGYDGQVVIHPDLTLNETDASGTTITKSRASLVFHELAESYERTHNNINYQSANGVLGAHDLAIAREKKWHGQSNMPGSATKVNKATRPSKREVKKMMKKINKHMGYGN